MKRTTRLLALLVALLLALPMAALAESTPVVYRELYSSEVDTLNYLYTTTANNLTIPANVVDTLIEYDRYGVLQPSLAESWEHNEDYTEWTFHIREGVKWVDSQGNYISILSSIIDGQDFQYQYVLREGDVLALDVSNEDIYGAIGLTEDDLLVWSYAPRNSSELTTEIYERAQ